MATIKLETSVTLEMSLQEACFLYRLLRESRPEWVGNDLLSGLSSVIDEVRRWTTLEAFP